MQMEEKFYLLVIDEFRAQPGLSEAIESVDLQDYATRFAGLPLDQALDQIARRQPLGPIKGVGFSILQELGPEPQEAPINVDNLGIDGSSLPAVYERLCRQALINLLWRNFAAPPLNNRLKRLSRERKPLLRAKRAFPVWVYQVHAVVHDIPIQILTALFLYRIPTNPPP